MQQIHWTGGLARTQAAVDREETTRYLKSFEHLVEVWKDWVRLKKELATIDEKLPPVELLPAKRKKQSPVDKNNPEMGIDSVARQMHQKTVQHYWVNIVKQQVTGGGVPHLETR